MARGAPFLMSARRGDEVRIVSCCCTQVNRCGLTPPEGRFESATFT
jgi:hypothetical protein